ncbi:MAG: hypothetical protein JXB23_04090, partial [Candidatus Aminicenantes bacterium]|nr:hypothetical protein [Candidatus Aminicenantes bacterium]
EMIIGLGQEKKMLIVLSESSGEYESPRTSRESSADGNDSNDAGLRSDPVAELKFSHNQAYTPGLRDRVTRAYLDDVMIKIKSDCLPDGNPKSVRMKMRNRLRDKKNPIYIVIKSENETRYSEYHQQFYRINRCGGAFKNSNVVYLYPASFTDECGSLEAVLFHELLHLAGLKDDTAYAATEKCYSFQALKKPFWPMHNRD